MSDTFLAGQSTARGTRLLLTLISVATGILVANLYYAQPLTASISAEIGIRPDLAGSVVSITQLAYALGLFFIVSLADLVENKKLILTMIAITIVALIGAALSTNAVMFFIVSFCIGLCSVGTQVLLPFVSHIVPEERRGRVVGNVMVGLLTGIMLARPISLLIAGALGWRAVFWISAGVMVVIGVLLALVMPRHRPHGGMHYGQIIASMAGLIRNTPALRWRAVYQALLFAAFNMFWTAAPIMLAERFGLNQQAIGLFALAGVGGALAAPFAGRLADRGLIAGGTVVSMAVVALCYFGSNWAVAIGALAVLVVLAILIDAAVQANQVLSQRIIFSVAPAVRGRANAIFMTTTFLGGALGSMLATATYHYGGWNATAIGGGMIGVVALLLFAVEKRRAAKGLSAA